MNNLRLLRKDAGCCLYCYQAATNGALCESHWKRSLSRQQKHRIRRRKANLCEGCKSDQIIERPIGYVGKWCKTCFLKGVAARNLEGTHRWQDLSDLFDKSGGICPLSGRQMTLGMNCSIDHILPLARGGSHENGNLRWVWNDGSGVSTRCVRIALMRSS